MYSFKRKSLMIILALSFALTSCNKAEKSNTSKVDNTTQPEVKIIESSSLPELEYDYDKIFEGKTKLVYLHSGSERQIDEAIENELNRILVERGYDYIVDFVENIEYSEDGFNSLIKSYEDRIEKGQNVDIFYTGSSISSDINEVNDTYNHCIEKGYLEPLNDYFGTKDGKKLYNQFDEKYWDRMRDENGIIYGKSAAYSVSAPMSITINNIVSHNFGFNIDKFDNSIESLTETLKAIHDKIQKPGLLLQASELPYWYLIGFEKTNSIYINTKTGYAENIFENDDFIAYSKMISELTKKGYATTDGNLISDTNLLAYIGQYNYLYATSDEFILTNSYYDNENISSATGISSTSEHKDEAFELLTLLNTDEEIANLIYNGIEDRNYELTDGKAEVNYNAPIPYLTAATTPTNPIIAMSKKSESDDKQANLDYQLEYVKKSPLYGFSLDTSITEKTSSIDQIYSKYFGLFYGEYDDVDATLAEANKELKAAGIDDIIAKTNAQLKVKYES
ncbi:MAG: DUF3502 domain-containing protein [Clostridiales bacterium]|nr:DUF3502 domain-containing protein [Clostridiales bacterium]